MVDCAHGRFPVPAPATADLLRGLPTYSAHIEKELVTPTGAALIRALAPTFSQQPAMRVQQIGYGAGTRNPKDFPNVLRLSIGEPIDTASISEPPSHAHLKSDPHQHHHNAQTVTVLETALDDLSPQVLAYVAEKALADGALDVMLTPVIMKKGRPGTLLTIICNPSERPALEQLVLRETSTLGLRIRQDTPRLPRPPPHQSDHSLRRHPNQNRRSRRRRMEHRTRVRRLPHRRSKTQRATQASPTNSDRCLSSTIRQLASINGGRCHQNRENASQETWTLEP